MSGNIVKATGWMEYDDLQKYRRDKKKGKI